MPAIPKNKPYRVGRSATGLGLFATKPIKKGSKIIRYFGPLLDSKKKKDDAIENKYLFELNNRWTIDGSVRKNIARYINHACKPNAESDVKPRKRKVIIRAIKNIEPGEEINYDYGTDYFKAYLKPIGCKCAACEKKRKKQRAEARAEKARLKAKAERKELKKAEKLAREKAEAKAKLKEKAEREAKKALKLDGASPEGKALKGKGLKTRVLETKAPKSKSSGRTKGKALNVKSGAGKSPNGKHLNGNGRVRGTRKKPAERPTTEMTLEAFVPAPVLQAEPAIVPEVSSAGLVH
jgi:hypothetical protein